MRYETRDGLCPARVPQPSHSAEPVYLCGELNFTTFYCFPHSLYWIMSAYCFYVNALLKCESH